MPGINTYNALISACEKGKQPWRALEVFQALQRQGMVPEVFTHNALTLIKAEKLFSKADMKQLMKICVYISKMCLYDYDMVKQTSNMMQGLGVLFVALKLMEVNYKSFPIRKYVIFKLEKPFSHHFLG